MERERSGMSEEEERARGTGWFRPSPSRENRNTTMSTDGGLPPPRTSASRERDAQERIEAFRRGYLADNNLEHVPPRIPTSTTPPVPSNRRPPPPRAPSLLENALKHLADLRGCTRYEERLWTAMDNDLATKEFFADKHDDFILELDELDAPSRSSWLQPGTVFEGHQHASSLGASSHAAFAERQRRTAELAHSVEQINPHWRPAVTNTASVADHPPGSTSVRPFDALRPWSNHSIPPNPRQPAHASASKLNDPQHDHWPVRVVLHSIDEETMTLQGTMEAYDVPQHPAALSILNAAADRPKAGQKHAPITTYLEGHIIDFRTHSFLTPEPGERSKRLGSRGVQHIDPMNATPYTRISPDILFPSANPHTDASNWRKLPPFNSLSSDDELARLLLSKSHLNNINEDYIFMRWKERCFIHAKNDTCDSEDRRGDQDRGHGLTISGFYYVSMKRSDGSVEGLYYDPTSTPYQHLRLKGQAAARPSWGFR